MGFKAIKRENFDESAKPIGQKAELTNYLIRLAYNSNLINFCHGYMLN
jgi:hypothetical protein